MTDIRTKEDVRQELIDKLSDNEDLFIEICEELDNWNGFLSDDRCYCMEDLDDLCSGMTISEFLDKLSDSFRKGDDYFYFSIYGIDSTDDKYTKYRDVYTEEEVVDELLDNYNHLYLSDDELKELCEEWDQLPE